MLRLCSAALVTMVAGLYAAPAPVWRGSASPKTPYEVMLAQLVKTRKAAGSGFTLGGTWELTAGKVAGTKLFQPVLTFKDRDGRVVMVTRARAGEISPSESKMGASLLLRFGEGVAQDGSECSFDARHLVLSLTGKR